MRILFLTHAFNSLAQRLYVELRALGHEVSVELDINEAVTEEAVALFDPDIVLAPFLKRAIPASIYQQRPCLIVHPGPPGDAGPAALDHAILDDAAEWGVTVLQATAILDGGPVWAKGSFRMRNAIKSSLYRHEVTEAAVTAVLDAINRFETHAGPLPNQPVRRVWRGPLRTGDRAIDWAADTTSAILRKIASADSAPGAEAEIAGRRLRVFDARPAALTGPPGTLVARSGPAVGVATRDGAVWIGRLIDRASDRPFKLPAMRVLGEAAVALPEKDGYAEILYTEADGVGFLSFAFVNGAMGVGACRSMLLAYREATARPTRVIVLAGGPDHWSNGIDLNEIEAADSPADASFANIEAMDDLAEAIIRTTDRLTIAAVGGNAGAGGVFLARAADEIWLRRGIVLNPHYKDMGNLHGSEYWTYLLPKHCGAENAARIAAQRLPMGADQALSLGLADRVLPGGRADFDASVKREAERLANEPCLALRLAEKQNGHASDEAAKPLSVYRVEELMRMKRNFFGFDPSYHVARSNFVRKVPKSRTPSAIATHRGGGARPQRMSSP